MIIFREITPWHGVRAGIIMFSCFVVAYYQMQIFGNNILRAGGSVCEIVSSLQMNPQAYNLQPFKNIFLHLLPYCLQHSGNILDHFENVCRSSHTMCKYSEIEFSWIAL